MLLFLLFINLLSLTQAVFFNSKSSWNVAVFVKKNQKKRIIIMGQVPGGKQLPAMGASLAWTSFVSAKSQASSQHAERKSNLGVCSLYPLSSGDAGLCSCPQCGKCLQSILNGQLM